MDRDSTGSRGDGNCCDNLVEVVERIILLAASEEMGTTSAIDVQRSSSIDIHLPHCKMNEYPGSAPSYNPGHGRLPHHHQILPAAYTPSIFGWWHSSHRMSVHTSTNVARSILHQSQDVHYSALRHIVSLGNCWNIGPLDPFQVPVSNSSHSAHRLQSGGRRLSSEGKTIIKKLEVDQKNKVDVIADRVQSMHA